MTKGIAILTTVLILTGCAQSTAPEDAQYNGIVAISRQNDEVYLRGASCTKEQPITALRLVPAAGDAVKFDITPDDSAVIRFGTMDELESLIGEDEWTLELDGVEAPIHSLTFTYDDIEEIGVGGLLMPEVTEVQDHTMWQDIAKDVCPSG